MGAAFLAFCEALVDTVAVAFVGDDENAGFGVRSRGGREEQAGQ